MSDPKDKGTGQPRPDSPIPSDRLADSGSTDRSAGSPLPRTKAGAGITRGSSEDGESRYSSGPDRPMPPLQVRIEVRVIDGREGRLLRSRQAAAIREALRWFAAHQEPRRADAASPDRPGPTESD